MKKPKILYFDIETTPLKAYIWRPGDQFVGQNQLVEGSELTDIICIGYCWDNNGRMRPRLKKRGCQKSLGNGSCPRIKTKSPLRAFCLLAAGVGFEPTVPFRVQLFSRQPHSSTLASRLKINWRRRWDSNPQAAFYTATG